VLAIGTYIAIQKYSTRQNVIAKLENAAERLHAALEAQASQRGDYDAETDLAAVENHAETVHRMNRASMAPLGDAADDYLVSAREILRRHVDMNRARTRLAVSFETFAQHVKSDRGAADWPQQAVQLKQAADKDARDLRIATESYASLLASFPASQTRIAPHVDARYLIDDKLIAEARSRALDAFAKADENMKAVGNIDAYRARGR
jgi:hypothetical protein